MDVKARLDQAIAAARAGRKEEARRLLESVLNIDERNEQAWLWLSGVVDSQEERIVCLENVLTINPDNEMARKGLAALRAAPVADEIAPPDVSQGTVEHQSPTEGLESPTPASALEAEASDGEVSDDHDKRVFILITLVLVLVLICTVISILAFVILSPLG